MALNPEGIPSDSPVRTQHRLYPAAQQAQPLEAPRISQDTGRMACVANWTNRRIVFYSGPHSKLSTFELLCYSVFRLEQGTKICYILPSKPKRTDGKGRFHSASGHKGMPHAFHFKSDTIMTQSSEPLDITQEWQVPESLWERAPTFWYMCTLIAHRILST